MPQSSAFDPFDQQDGLRRRSAPLRKTHDADDRQAFPKHERDFIACFEHEARLLNSLRVFIAREADAALLDKLGRCAPCPEEPRAPEPSVKALDAAPRRHDF